MSDQEYTSLQLRLTAEAERIGASANIPAEQVPTVPQLESRRKRRQIVFRSAVASIFSAVVIGAVVVQPGSRAVDHRHSDIAAQFDDSTDKPLHREMEIPLAPSARAHLESLADRGAVPVVVIRPDENGRQILIPGVFLPPQKPRDLSPLERRAIRNVLGSDTETRPDAI